MIRLQWRLRFQCIGTGELLRSLKEKYQVDLSKGLPSRILFFSTNRVTINWLVVSVLQLGEAGLIGLLILRKRLYMSGVVRCGLRMVTKRT
jgi:hypothetical protein